jgi:glycosyltransferase involved in cell wall biosynthesis
MTESWQAERGKPHVVISGPLPPPPGGIAAVIRTIVEGALRDRYAFTSFNVAEPHRRDDFAWRTVNRALSRGLGRDGAYNLVGRARFAAYRALFDRRVDIAHLHVSHGYDTWLGVRMARFAKQRGVKTILHLHGLFDVVVPKLPARVQRAFWRALAVPDRLVVLSDGWRRWFEQGVPAERISMLRNPVDVRRFGPRRERPGDDTLRLLFAGMSDPVRKGIHEILAAAPAIVAALPNARFVCVGQDVERIEETRVRGTALAPFFSFEGSKNGDQMVAYFEGADLLLLPSHSEGLPIALLEAMAASLPVVSCPVNGIPEAMSDPDNGRLIPPRDPAALAQAVIELARDPERRARIGAANRRRVEREFDQSAYAEGLGAIYAALYPG